MTNKLDDSEINDLGEQIVELTDENISQEQINEMKMLGLPKPDGVSSERWWRLQNFRIEHKHMIRMAAMGTPQGKIAEAMGYDEAHVSKVLNTPEFKAEIEKEIRDIYDEDWKQAVKDRNAKASAVVDEVLEFGSLKEKSAMSRWVLEHQIGKPTQTIEEKKTSLSEVIIKIEQMQSNQLRDVGSNSNLLPTKPDPFDTVIEQVVPKGMVIGKRSSSEGET